MDNIIDIILVCWGSLQRIAVAHYICIIILYMYSDVKKSFDAVFDKTCYLMKLAQRSITNT